MNTCSQFQVWAGKSALSAIPGILLTFEQSKVKNPETGEESVSPMALAMLDLRSLHLLAAAALHRYRSEEPIFDMTPGRLGATLTFEQWAELFKLLLKGIGNFLPKQGDGPPAMEDKSDRPTGGASQQNHSAMNGKAPSTPSPVDILGTLTLDSDEQPSRQSGSDGEPTSKPRLVEMSGR